MKRFVVSLVAASALVAGPVSTASPALAWGGGGEKGSSSHKTSNVCSNANGLQLQLLCVGSITVPIIVSVLSGNKILNNNTIV
jgi:hypothetical protein